MTAIETIDTINMPFIDADMPEEQFFICNDTGLRTRDVRMNVPTQYPAPLNSYIQWNCSGLAPSGAQNLWPAGIALWDQFYDKLLVESIQMRVTAVNTSTFPCRITAFIAPRSFILSFNNPSNDWDVSNLIANNDIPHKRFLMTSETGGNGSVTFQIDANTSDLLGVDSLYYGDVAYSSQIGTANNEIGAGIFIDSIDPLGTGQPIDPADNNIVNIQVNFTLGVRLFQKKLQISI